MEVQLKLDDVSIALGYKGITLKIWDNQGRQSATFGSAGPPSSG